MASLAAYLDPWLPGADHRRLGFRVPFVSGILNQVVYVHLDWLAEVSGTTGFQGINSNVDVGIG